MQQAPLEDFAVKVLVGFDGIHGVLVVNVGETFAGVGFAVDGEVDLQVRARMLVIRMAGIWRLIFQREMRWSESLLY